MKKACSTCGESKNANPSKESEFGWNKGRYRYDCKACVSAKARSKKRDAISKKGQEDLSPPQKVIANIMLQSRMDYEKYGHITGKPNRTHGKNKSSDLADACSMAQAAGYANPRDELLAFFAGDRFEELCEVSGLEPECVRKHIGA